MPACVKSSRNSADTPSQNSFGEIPAAAAAVWIFKPCSSVPGKENRTSELVKKLSGSLLQPLPPPCWQGYSKINKDEMGSYIIWIIHKCVHSQQAFTAIPANTASRIYIEVVEAYNGWKLWEFFHTNAWFIEEILAALFTCNVISQDGKAHQKSEVTKRDICQFSGGNETLWKSKLVLYYIFFKKNLSLQQKFIPKTLESPPHYIFAVQIK